MTKIFIDSDILIDFLIDRQPFSESSTKIISLCSENKIKGFVTPMIIANIFYILRKSLSKSDLKIKFINLLKFIDIIEMNKATVLNALYSDFNDFEDALQNFAVEKKSEIKLIITRNLKDYRKSSLSVYTPESFLKTVNK
jgi:predicted nucleic acid-binding protein